MLNIGPGELLAISIIALIVLGPEKLPQAVRTVGRVTGELRRMSNGFQSELQNALREDPPEARRVTPERRTPNRAPSDSSGSTGSMGSTEPESAGTDSGGTDSGGTEELAAETPDTGSSDTAFRDAEDPTTGGAADTITEDALDNPDRL